MLQEIWRTVEDVMQSREPLGLPHPIHWVCVLNYYIGQGAGGDFRELSASSESTLGG